MNNKFRQAIFVLNLDQKLMMIYLSPQNTFIFFIFIGIFHSYPQFLYSVYATVDKYVNNYVLFIISRETL